MFLRARKKVVFVDGFKKKRLIIFVSADTCFQKNGICRQTIEYHDIKSKYKLFIHSKFIHHSKSDVFLLLCVFLLLIIFIFCACRTHTHMDGYMLKMSISSSQIKMKAGKELRIEARTQFLMDQKRGLIC